MLDKNVKRADDKQQGKNKSWLRRHLVTIIIVAVLLLGLVIMFYPNIANYWNSFHQTRAISSYMENITAMDTESYDTLIREARDYNQKICDNGIKWMLSDEEVEEYESLLNFAQTGIMGYIQIDKINITLPLYHGVSEAVLQTSIGHLEGSSLPVGCESFNTRSGEVENKNEGNHIVLSGHRGLPSAQLFSNLDKLVEGDTFTLNILNETYSYQVDQIRIVLPSDLSDLTLEKGQDYCTLVTCTPYGINTHRLLVRGHRVANPNGDMKVVADAMQIDKLYVAPFIGIPIVAILLVIMIIVTGRRRTKNRVTSRVVRELSSDNTDNIKVD